MMEMSFVIVIERTAAAAAAENGWDSRRGRHNILRNMANGNGTSISVHS
jgi:hypothetical protein